MEQVRKAAITQTDAPKDEPIRRHTEGTAFVCIPERGPHSVVGQLQKTLHFRDFNILIIKAESDGKFHQLKI